MRTRVAELSAQIQTAASLHDRLALEKQSLESSVAELKVSILDSMCASLTHPMVSLPWKLKQLI